MNNLSEKVTKLVDSEMSIDTKIQKLRQLGLKNSVIRSLLYSQIKDEPQNYYERQEILWQTGGACKSYTKGYMKCLAIQQPFATLVAYGIKDVELRDRMIPPCKAFLIAASSRRFTNKLEDALSDEELDVVQKYMRNGTLPPYSEWPTSAIIGYACIKRVTFDDVDSVWATGHYGIKYLLQDAHLLDSPIYGKNKATPFFYNVDGFDENHLPPAHKVKL